MSPRYIAVLSIGSNVAGDLAGPAEQLGRALKLLASAEVEILETSRVFTTPPWGGVEQVDFYNQSLTVATDLDPLALLHHCQAVERAADRRREVRWGPRTLDVDVVWMATFDADSTPTQVHSTNYSGGSVWGEELILPHPFADQRAFVLVPWLDLKIASEPWCTLQGSTIAHWVSTLETQDVTAVKAVTSK